MHGASLLCDGSGTGDAAGAWEVSLPNTRLECRVLATILTRHQPGTGLALSRWGNGNGGCNAQQECWASRGRLRRLRRRYGLLRTIRLAASFAHSNG